MPTKTKRTILGKVMHAWLLMVVLGMLVTSCTPSFDPLSELRGSRQVLIRLPQQPERSQEDILIVRDTETHTTDVSYGPSNPKAPGVTIMSYDHVALDEETWQHIEQMQQQWCTERPQWDASPPYYIIAMQCPDYKPYLGYVPETALPPSLQTIIHMRP